MVRKDILNGAFEFIKNSPNCNQSDIVRGLKGVCTRLPVLDAIRELTSDKDGTIEPKIKFSRNTPKGSYRYYVNDKNVYVNAVSLVDKMAKHLNIISITDSFTKGVNEHQKELLELMKYSQLTDYQFLAYTATGISRLIQDREDREALNLRLVELLVVLSKLNAVTYPSPELIFDNAKKLLEKRIEDKKILDSYLPKINKMKEQKKLSRSDLLELQKIKEIAQRIKDSLC